MSRLEGGIFSRPRGKTGGIVFGAARSRIGKLVTSRLLVRPTNPNTPLQQTQRTKFSEVLNIVRTLGPSIYQSDFNRSVGQLPGFQSMESIFLNQMDSSFNLSLTLEVNLGTLHFPDSVTFSTGGPGVLNVQWSNEIGANGTVSDIITILLIAKTSTLRELPGTILFSQSSTRADSPASFFPMPAGQYEIYFYLKGAGTASGLLSVAKPFSFTVD